MSLLVRLSRLFARDASEQVRPDTPETTVGLSAVVDGLVAVRSGRINVIDPVGMGRPAMLVPGENTVVEVNGEVAGGPVPVTADAAITVRPRYHSSVTGDRKIQIEVSEDELQVFLHLGPMPGGVWSIPDQGPGHTVHVEALLVSPPMPPLQPEVVLAELRTLGVSEGIDRLAISRALNNPDPVSALIATGKPAQQGRPGEVHPRFPVTASGEMQPETYRARSEADALIADVSPPVPGVSGRTCLGGIIVPMPVAGAKVTLGRGVAAYEGGRLIRGLQAGRPVIHHHDDGRWWIDVIPVSVLTPEELLAAGTATAERGDIEVTGDLIGPATLESVGAVWIRGSVEGVRIEAGEAVVVDGLATQSYLATVIPPSPQIQLSDLIRQLHEDLVELLDTTQAVINHPGYARASRQITFSQVTRLLLQHRFTGIGVRLDQLRKMLENMRAGEFQANRSLLSTGQYYLAGAGSPGLEELSSLIDLADQALREAPRLKDPQRPPQFIRVDKLIDCEVSTEGTVELGDEGSTRSRVQASNIQIRRTQTAGEPQTAS